MYEHSHSQKKAHALCAVSPMEPASLNLPFGAQTAGGVLRPTKKKEMKVGS